MNWAPLSLKHVPRDVVAGLVVGIIALPLSIALAVAVGVPPIAGLYTAIFAGAAAAVFGGSNYNITGPTAALVPILSHVVLLHGAGALPMVGLLAGLMLLAFSFLKFGRLIRFMPGPVIVGFTAGIALSIAFGQLNNFLAVTGTDPTLEHFHEKLWDTVRHLHTIGLATPAVGVASLAILVAWTRIPVLIASRDRLSLLLRSHHAHGRSASIRRRWQAATATCRASSRRLRCASSTPG